MNFSQKIRCWAILIWLLPPAAWAGLDEKEFLLSSGSHPRIFMERTYGPPDLIGGRTADSRDGSILLHPGEFTTLRLSFPEATRIFAEKGFLTSEDLQAWISDGSGVYVRKSFTESPDGDCLVFQSGQSDAPWFGSSPFALRVIRPEECPDSLKIRVERSITRFPPRIGEDGTPLPLPGDAVSLAEGPFAAKEDWWVVEPGTSSEISVRGPVRLTMIHRMIYGPEDSTPGAVGLIRIDLDNRHFRSIDAEYRPERRTRVLCGNIPVTVSGKETDHFHIPAGEHGLKISSTLRLYMQIREPDASAYLFPGINAHKPLLPDTSPGWVGSPEALEAFCRKVARDNHRKEGGLSGTMLMAEVGKRHPEFAPFSRLARKWMGIMSFYRDLFPSLKNDPSDQTRARFFPVRLKDPLDSSCETILFEQHILETARRTPSAFFLDVPEEGMKFLLPRRYTQGLLRVVVDSDAAVSDETDFEIHMDDGEVFQMRAVKGPEFSETEFLPSIEKTALELSEEDPFPPHESILQKAGSLEIPLPEKVREIVIRKTGSGRLRMGLQYRVSRPFSLDEASYEAMVKAAGGRVKLMESLRRLAGFPISDSENKVGSIEDPGEAHALNAMENHLLPLARLLRSMVPDLNEEDVSDSAPSSSLPSAGEDCAKDARKAEAERRWVQAFEKWREIYYRSTGEVRQEAFFSSIRVLEKMGETFISENLLRGLLIRKTDPEMKAAAISHLTERYRKAGDFKALLSLDCLVWRDHPSFFSARELTKALLNAGYPEAAARFGLLLPDEERGFPELGKALAISGWFHTARKILPSIEDESVPVHMWRELPEAVCDYAGAGLLENEARNLAIRSFRADPDRPVIVRVAGPGRFRIDSRSVLQDPFKEPDMDRLLIREGPDTGILPIFPGSPSENIRSAIPPYHSVGRETSAFFDLGPGIHSIGISALSGSLFLRVFQQMSLSGNESIPFLPESPEKPVKDRERFWIPEQEGIPPSPEWKKMVRLLWATKNEPESFMENAAEAEALFHAHSELPGLAGLVSFFTRELKWEITDSIIQSAGIRYFPVQGWQPESPALRVRKALVPEWPEKGHVLYDTTRLVLSLENPEPTALEVEISVADAESFPVAPVTVRFQEDDGPARVLTLDRNRPWNTILRIPEGGHYLLVQMLEKSVNQFLLVRVWEKGGDGRKTELPDSYNRIRHVSTKAEPLVALIEGPVWIRVDEYRDGQTISDYRKIPPGRHEIKLSPLPGQKERLLRIFRRVKNTGEKIRMIPYRTGKTALPVPPPRFHILSSVEPDPEIDRKFEKWAPFTPTIFAGYYRRSHDSDDPDESMESFLETGAAFRSFDSFRRTYESGRILSRHREKGEPVLGFAGTFSKHPVCMPYSFRLTGTAFFQRPGADDYPEGSATIQGVVAGTREIDAFRRHVPALTLFGRYLSGTYDRGNSERIDRDVFTLYKSDHRLGIRFSDTLKWNPFLDTLFYGRGSITGNETLVDPDNAGLDLGLRQLLGNFQVELFTESRYYFDDSDREKDLFRNRAGLIIEWSRQGKKGGRWEASLKVRRNMDEDTTDAEFGIKYHFGNKGFHDFRPGETDFRRIRESKTPYPVMENDENRQFPPGQSDPSRPKRFIRTAPSL